MTDDLERRLTALGATLAFPPTPDLAPRVLAALPHKASRRRPTRRALVLALAAALLIAGGAMAAPPTRDTILRILGLRGVSIVRVPRLPPLPAGARLGLGQPISLARARHAASFTAVLPPASATAFLDHDVPGGRISLVTGRVLIMEFRGTTPPYIVKVVGPDTAVKPVRVNGRPGIYLSGAPHEVLVQTQTGDVRPDRVRLAGNVLLWQQGRLTIRIEGIRTLGQGLALARTLR